ncbi:MAG: hypothetical protein U0931_25305 [Vulcanimicrobiota bacterium]
MNEQPCHSEFCEAASALERETQRARDLRLWEDWLEGLSGPEPPFAI